MKAVDRFLARHEVDVGKCLGVLSFAGAVFAFYAMIGQLLVGRIHIDLSVPIGIIIGSALWKHSPWSRTLLLVVSWGVAVVLAALLVAIPFIGTKNLTLTMGGAVIKHPPLWQAYTVGILALPIVWFILSVLHSERARSEFQKPNKAPEPTPTSVTSPAAQEPRQP